MTRAEAAQAFADADAELERRAQARRRFIDYVRYTFEGYRVDYFHEHLADTLDELVAGDVTRLLVTAPAQHGKSELVSHRLPGYWFGHYPDVSIILASYEATHAQEKSRRARAVVESEEHLRLFPSVRTDPTSRSVHAWGLAEHLGRFVCAGIGGPLTGHGGGLGLIDDPVKDWLEAMSSVYRARGVDWYQTVFRKRMRMHARIGVIMTRWHEADLGGWLMKEDEWRVVDVKGEPRPWVRVNRYTALAEDQGTRDANDDYLGLPIGQPDLLGREPGECLAPSIFSQEEEEARRVAAGRHHAAQDQGVPRPHEGGMFKRDWVQYGELEDIPGDAVWVRYWDEAATAGGGDWTAGVLLAYSRQLARSWVVDVVRGQWESGARRSVIDRTAVEDQRRRDVFSEDELDEEGNPVLVSSESILQWFEEEPGRAGKDAARDTVDRLSRLGVPARTERPIGSKAIRADDWAAAWENGQVYLIRGAWNRPFLEVHVAFGPGCAHDDDVDAAGGAYRKARDGGVRVSRVARPGGRRPVAVGGASWR